MITCPKCGFEQPKSSDCVRCGIHFKKYAELQARIRADGTDEQYSHSRKPFVLGEVSRQSLHSSSVQGSVAPVRRAPHTRISRSHARDTYLGLSRLLAAGFSPVQAFVTLEEAATSRVQLELAHIRGALQQGHTLPEAFAAAPKLFTSSDIALLDVFHQVGDVVGGLQALAQRYDDLLNLRNTFVRGLTYPIIVIAVACFVLPLPTLVMSGSSAYFSGVLVRLAGLIAVSITLGWVLPRCIRWSPVNRRLKSLAWGRPWPATIWTHHVRCVFFATLAQNLDAGLPLHTSIKTASGASNDLELDARIALSLNAIEREGLAKPLKRIGLVLPPDVLVLSSGEQAGTIVDSLKALAQRYRDAREIRVRWFTRLTAVCASISAVAIVSWGIFDTYRGVTSQADSVLEALGSGSDLDSLDLGELKNLDIDSLSLPELERRQRGPVNRGGSRR